MNAHLKIRIAKTDIQRVLASLALAPGFDPDDEQLKSDMLEGETSLHEVVSQLLAENEDDEGIVNALDAQVDARAIRIERAKARIEGRKNAISALMDCAQETTLKLPEATLSLRTLKPRPKVTDADALPDDFVTIQTVRKPDNEAIKAAFEAGQSIPGVTMTNGGSSLTVRRK
jgi:hypothetical protein